MTCTPSHFQKAENVARIPFTASRSRVLHLSSHTLFFDVLKSRLSFFLGKPARYFVSFVCVCVCTDISIDCEDLRLY
jgi:hypothetical protein